MKRILLTLTVLGSILLGACEKEELKAPADKSLIKADKDIMCRGCGQWDFNNPEDSSGTAAFRSATSADTIVAPAKKINPGKRKK